MSRPHGCTCQFGRDHDGSEFGPCESCERADDEERIMSMSKIKIPPMPKEPDWYEKMKDHEAFAKYSRKLQERNDAEREALWKEGPDCGPYAWRYGDGE